MGLTEREKAIWPPKKELDAISFSEKCLYFAIACVAIATLIHFTIEPKGTFPIVRNQQVGMSDRAQETLYCKQALAGYPTEGATMQTLQNHCKNFN